MLPPLLFDPIYKEKIWGGNKLALLLNKDISPQAKIGESWEISGFGNDISRVAEGPLMGTSLNDLFMQHRNELIGEINSFDTFPLLYKFIDAQDQLSVQVHPNDLQAQSNGWGSFGKTECWYVAHAEPGTQMIVGFNSPVSSEEIEESVHKESLPELLNYVDVRQGDVLFIPAGTVHATLKGAVLFEIQETSDTTFRFYDWGRNDPNRPLHITESLGVVDTFFHDRHKIPPVTYNCIKEISCRYRVACRYFSMIEYHFDSSAEYVVPSRKSFQVLTVLDGNPRITSEAGQQYYRKGQNILIPAACNKTVISSESGTRIVNTWVPDLRHDVIEPLQQQDVSNEAIRQLGGNPERNDLNGLI
ncbi:MAG: mannose-6-phosphate isomerase [Chitinivibrionales bacterium]|nr:mannose-6-phosphate isomerase [Chitinivibrionales bacterium]